MLPKGGQAGSRHSRIIATPSFATRHYRTQPSNSFSNSSMATTVWHRQHHIIVYNMCSAWSTLDRAESASARLRRHFFASYGMHAGSSPTNLGRQAAQHTFPHHYQPKKMTEEGLQLQRG